jgi:molybdopterin/thiamine biosynthesis adenylyltransferase
MGFSRLIKTSYNGNNIGTISIALIGLGTLGSEIARLLGLLGVGSVILIDHGSVEPVNLTQNLFFREQESLHQPKAQVIAQKGLFYFPETKWVPVFNEIADVGFGQLANCALIFSATDSMLARLETAYISRRLNIPMLDVGLLGAAYWRGRAAWFPSNPRAACYVCQLNEKKRAELLSFSQSTVFPCQWTAENIDMPSTPTMSSAVAGMAIDLAFRHGLFVERHEAAVWELNLSNPPSLQSHQLTASVTCPFHDFDNIASLISLPHNIPLSQSLQISEIEAIELDWPIVAVAKCQQCNYSWHPMRRVAWVRKNLRCPQCGEANYLALEAVGRIAFNDPMATYSPKDLFFSKEHLYTPIYRNNKTAKD